MVVCNYSEPSPQVINILRDIIFQIEMLFLPSFLQLVCDSLLGLSAAFL